MSCSPFDLKDYLLQELADPEQRQVEAHVHACAACRQELDRLRLTQTTLACLVDEEIPQRIGFVSDKIFEPSPVRRWLGAFWNSGARLGFAAAAMLSVALMVSPLLRRPVPTVVTAQPVQTVSDAEIQRRVDAGVMRAVADIEARYSQRTEQMVKEIRLQDQKERQIMQVLAEEQVAYYKAKWEGSKRPNNVEASASEGAPR